MIEAEPLNLLVEVMNRAFMGFAVASVRLTDGLSGSGSCHGA